MEIITHRKTVIPERKIFYLTDEEKMEMAQDFLNKKNMIPDNVLSILVHENTYSGKHQLVVTVEIGNKEGGVKQHNFLLSRSTL